MRPRRKRPIATPTEFAEAYGIDAKSFSGIRSLRGGVLAGLYKRFKKKIPPGLVLGKTFKIQHKKVVFFGKHYFYPFELEEFERHYAELIA